MHHVNVGYRQIFANTKKLPFGKILGVGAILAFMVMMLINPDYYLDSARRGLSLYATSVLPSLFPFYFCSLMLTKIGAAKTISALGAKPVKLLFNAPKESAYILILSMMSGYPIGASMTAELYQNGTISKREAKCIAAFASTSGPIFILGTVGSAIFNDGRIGAIILAAHYLGAIMNGLIFRMRKRPDDTDRPIRIASYDDLLAETISNSTLSMLYVGGYIVLCGMLIDTLKLFNIDALILSKLGETAAQPVISLLFGSIEMTRGAIECAKCTAAPLGIALCAGIISLGGLSVTFQNYTFLSKCGMSFASIAIRKLVQAALGFAIALGLAYIFGFR